MSDIAHRKTDQNWKKWKSTGILPSSPSFETVIRKEVYPFTPYEVIINSSTSGSTKKFKLTIDDTGTLTTTEVTTS